MKKTSALILFVILIPLLAVLAPWVFHESAMEYFIVGVVDVDWNWDGETTPAELQERLGLIHIGDNTNRTLDNGVLVGANGSHARFSIGGDFWNYRTKQRQIEEAMHQFIQNNPDLAIDGATITVYKKKKQVESYTGDHIVYEKMLISKDD